MIFPLYTHQLFGWQADLVLAVLIGMGFGFVLERSGFGRAPILAAQFYFADTRVLKVMFTAIVTAAVGLELLTAFHVLDFSLVSVPATFIWPQIVGGLLLGFGFIVSGYCPGTSVVAAASGNIDGFVTVVGVGVGSLLFGFAWPVFANLYSAGDMGVLRLPDVLGLPGPIVALGVFLMATGAFFAAEKAEVFFAGRRGEEPPPSKPPLRNRVLLGLGIASLVGILGLLVPASPKAATEKDVAQLDAFDLARTLVENPDSVWLVDLRDAGLCERERIPGARCRDGDGLDYVASLPATRRLVAFDGNGSGDIPAEVLAYDGPVLRLRGGFEAFSGVASEVPVAPVDVTPASLAEYRQRAAIHAWFSGVERVPDAPVAEPVRVQVAAGPRKGGGC
jgi:hypothetical protein